MNSSAWNPKNELGDAAPTPEAASPRFAVAETATVGRQCPKPTPTLF